MRGVKGFSILACVLVLGSIALAACGSDDSGTEQRIARERREAAQQARQEERLKQLERELKKRNSSRSGDSSSGGGAAAPSSPGRSCGGGLSVNQNASCPFAENVRAAYERSGGSSTIEVFSPVTSQTYTMACSTGSPHVCTGGNNATVYFP